MSDNTVPVVDGWVASEPLCPATDLQAFLEAMGRKVDGGQQPAKAGAAAADATTDGTDHDENDEVAREQRRLAFIDMVKGNGERPEWATDEDVEMAAQLRGVISADAGAE